MGDVTEARDIVKAKRGFMQVVAASISWPLPMHRALRHRSSDWRERERDHQGGFRRANSGCRKRLTGARHVCPDWVVDAIDDCEFEPIREGALRRSLDGGNP